MSSYIPPYKRNTVVPVATAASGPALQPIKLTSLAPSTKDAPKPASQYIAPHMRTKLPPKELNGDDLTDSSLFPSLGGSKVEPSTPATPSTLSMNFAELVKQQKIEPKAPKYRTVLASLPYARVVVCDMSVAEMRIAKSKTLDEAETEWTEDVDVPNICFDNRLPPLEEDYDSCEDNQYTEDAESCITDGQWHLYESASEGQPEDVLV